MVSDNFSATNESNLNQSPAGGTLVGPGPHTITVTATDEAGNIATCTTTFTVSDTTAPVVTCAANLSASSDANCQALVPDVLAGVSVSDNCSATNAINLNQSPAADTLVGPRPHTLTVTATDQAGNIGTCTTTFTVSDTTAPALICAANLSATSDANCQAAVPDVLAGVSVSDKCSATNAISLNQRPAA